MNGSVHENFDAAERPGLMRRLVDGVTRHGIVLHHAALLSFGPILGAGLGFIFWWIAARTFDPDAVGHATAAISAMNVIALFACLSLGITMTGLHLNEMPNGHALVVAAAFLSAVAAILVFWAFVAIAGYFHLEIAGTLATPIGFALILAGGVAVTLMDLTNGSLTGYMRNGLRMTRESLAPIVRVALLLLALAVLGTSQEFASLVIPTIVSETVTMLYVVHVIRKMSGHVLTRPDMGGLIRLLPTALSHHLLNLTSLGPAVVMPLLMAESVSPAAAAAIFPAWMILQMVLLAPAGASTALFALGVRQPDQMGARLRFSLLVSLLISIAAAFVMLKILPPLLAFLNPAYPELGGSSLKFIGFGGIGMLFKQHYMAAMRFQGRMLAATPVLALGGLAEIGSAALGGYANGATGFVWGWLIGVHVLTVLTFPELRSVMSQRAPASQGRVGAEGIDGEPGGSSI